MSIGDKFLSSVAQPVSSWRVLLGVLSSLTPLVPGGSPPDEVSPAPSQSFLESGGQLVSGPAGRLLPSGSRLVAGSDSPGGGGGVSLSQVSPNLDFWSDVGQGRSLGRGGCFGPLVSKGDLSLHQRQGTLSCGEGSSPLPGSAFRVHGRRFRGQLHGSGLSAQGRGHLFVCSQHHCAADSPLGGDSPHCSRSAVHYGEEQCFGGFPVQAQPDPGLGMDSEDGGFSGSPQEVAGDDRLICHLVESLLFTLFFACHNPSALGTDALLQCWDGLQVYAFPPWSLIPLVLKKLRSSSRVLMTLIAPYWHQRPWFPDLLELMWMGRASCASSVS